MDVIRLFVSVCVRVCVSVSCPTSIMRVSISSRLKLYRYESGVITCVMWAGKPSSMLVSCTHKHTHAYSDPGTRILTHTAAAPQAFCALPLAREETLFALLCAANLANCPHCVCVCLCVRIYVCVCMPYLLVQPLNGELLMMIEGGRD